MRTSAIILAAGKGKRMGADVPKQYLKLQGNPILYYSIKAFDQSDVDELVIVVGQGEIPQCQKYMEKFEVKKPYQIVEGGKERYDSVYQGLMKIQNVDYILVHDGARPFIQVARINELIKTVKETNAAIIAVPVKDTIKQVDENLHVKKTIERKALYAVQTPQGFSYELMMEAYRGFFEDDIENQSKITDDAMLVESYTDTPISIVYGDYNNIKITTPEDLILSEYLVSASRERKRMVE